MRILLLALILIYQAPQDAKVKKAQEKLLVDQENPEANLTVAKDFAFAKGEWDKAISHFAKSSDDTFRDLALMETASPQTGSQKMEMGNAWFNACKKYPAYTQKIQERATFWYTSAWSDLDGSAKNHVRERLRKVHQNPKASPQKGLSIPKDWQGPTPDAKVFPSSVATRAGKLALQVTAFEHPRKGYAPIGQTVLVKGGASYEFSAWVLTDGTDSADDAFIFPVYSAEGKPIWHPVVPILPDQPWWKKVATKFTVPEGSVKVSIGLVLNSRKGTLFLDDVSLKADGKELVKNGSFEQ